MMTKPADIQELNRVFVDGRELWSRRDHTALLTLLAAVPRARLLEEPDLMVWYIFSLVKEYRTDEALRLVGTAIDVARDRGNERAHRRLLNAEGAALMAAGYLQSAIRSFSEATLLAGNVGDEHLIAAAGLNLGIVADIRCDYDEALCAYSRSVVAAQRIGEPALIGACHHNIAMSYRQIGFWTASDANFVLAADAFVDQPPENRIGTASERALLYFLRGDRTLAEAAIDRVLTYSERVCNETRFAEILRIHAIITAASHPRQARANLERSLAIARSTTNRLLEAEVLEELAALDMDQGMVEAAHAKAAESMRVYEWIGSPARAAAVRQRLGIEAPPAPEASDQPPA